MKKRMFALFLMFVLFIPANSCERVSASNGSSTVKPESFSVQAFTKKTVLVNVESVCKECDDTDKKSKHSGSGTIIYSCPFYSLILTANHVVEVASYKRITSIKVSRFIDGVQEEKHSAYVVNTDTKHDVALIQVLHDYGVNTKIGRREQLGSRVHVLGFPANLLNRGTHVLSYVRGNVATINLVNSKGYGPFTRYTAPIYFGNSGGSVFNDNGEVISVVCFMFARYSIPLAGYYYGPGVKVIRELLMNSRFSNVLVGVVL